MSIDKVFKDFEKGGPPWASEAAKHQYEAIRDTLLPKLNKALTQAKAETVESCTKAWTGEIARTLSQYIVATSEDNQTYFLRMSKQNLDELIQLKAKGDK